MKIQAQITNGDWHTIKDDKSINKADFIRWWRERDDACLIGTATKGMYITKGSIIAIYFD